MESVARAREINRKWIIRGNLDQTASDYLDSLEKAHDERLNLSCDLALRALKLAGETRKLYDLDRKACFYPALFFFVNPSEMQTFLKDHPFTRNIVQSARNLKNRKPTLSENFVKGELDEKAIAKTRMVVSLLLAALDDQSRNAPPQS